LTGCCLASVKTRDSSVRFHSAIDSCWLKQIVLAPRRNQLAAAVSLPTAAIRGYRRASSVPRERVKRERCASRLGRWSGGKSAAAPATVSGERLDYPPAKVGH
jgi:hypothetical protein